MAGPYTLQECIDVVRNNYPGAEAFSRPEPCHSTVGEKCACMAQIGIAGVNWNPSNGYHSCVFGDKRK